jgi:hypothetical protein
VPAVAELDLDTLAAAPGFERLDRNARRRCTDDVPRPPLTPVVGDHNCRNAG